MIEWIITLVLWLMTFVFFFLWYLCDRSVGRKVIRKTKMIHIGFKRKNEEPNDPV